MNRAITIGLAVLAGLALAARRKPAAPAPKPPASPAPPPAPAPPADPVPAPMPPPEGLPPDADPAAWVQLVDEPGLEVRFPSRAWTTAAARAVLRQAAAAALALGGKLHVADAGPAAGPGNEYPPHKSHRWGRDFDIGYTLDGYPTPADVAVDPRVPAALETIAPWIETVGVNAVRAAPFAGRPYKVSTWSGHIGHLHLRLRKNLTTEP